MGQTRRIILPRRIMPLAVALCIVWAWVSVPAFAAEGGEKQTAYNIVLLIDKSGSMNYTDAKKQSLSAAKMFVDSFYAAISNKPEAGAVRSKIGILAFSEEVQLITAPIEISTKAETKYAIGYIDTIDYDKTNTGATDLGKAVTSAEEMLQSTNDGSRKNLIVVFTDGYIEFLDSDPEKEKKEEASEKLLEEGLHTAREMDCEIYVIGLNYKDRIKEKGREGIQKIADFTQTGEGIVERAAIGAQGASAHKGANYLITDSYEKINEFYIRLFARLVNSVEPIPLTPTDDGEWLFYDVDIDSKGLSCANIYLVSDADIEDLRLWAPDGRLVELDDGSIYLTRDEGYAILSLLEPASGRWRIGLQKGLRDYWACYVPVAGIYLDLTDPAPQNNTVKVQVKALYEGEEQGADFYEQIISADCTAVYEDGKALANCALEYDSRANVLTGTLTVPRPGRYILRAEVHTAQIEQWTERQADFPIAEKPIQLTVRRGKATKKNVGELLTDWDRVSLSIDSVECMPENLAEISTKGDEITIRGLATGKVELIVHATDNMGGTWDIPGNVKIVFDFLPYLPYAAVLLAVIIAVACLLIRKLRRIPGKFAVKCEYNGKGLPLSSITGPVGSSFSLYQLTETALKSLQDNQRAAEILSVLRKQRTKLERPEYCIHVVKNKDGGGRCYCIGPDRKPLSGKVFRDDDLGLNITVKFQPN